MKLNADLIMLSDTEAPQITATCLPDGSAVIHLNNPGFASLNLIGPAGRLHDLLTEAALALEAAAARREPNSTATGEPSYVPPSFRRAFDGLVGQ